MDDEFDMDDGIAIAEKIRLLERIPLFAALDRATLTRVADVVEKVEVPAGTTLTHEGRHEGYFYIVVAGTVEVRRGGVAFDTSGAGSFIGEISLLDAGSRTATAVTVSPCLLLKANNRGFDDLLEADPSIREALESAMGSRLERMDAEASSKDA